MPISAIKGHIRRSVKGKLVFVKTYSRQDYIAQSQRRRRSKAIIKKNAEGYKSATKLPKLKGSARLIKW